MCTYIGLSGRLGGGGVMVAKGTASYTIKIDVDGCRKKKCLAFTTPLVKKRADPLALLLCRIWIGMWELTKTDLRAPAKKYTLILDV